MKINHLKEQFSKLIVQLCTLRLGTISLILVGIMFWSVPEKIQAGSILDEVKNRGKLRVAGVVYRPLQMRKPSGEYYGADPDLLKQFADHLGVKLEIVSAEWATAVAGITTGKWDLVPALCVTPKRKEAIDFSETYLMLGGVLTALKGNDKINALADANRSEITIANVAGGWSEQIAKKAFPLQWMLYLVLLRMD